MIIGISGKIGSGKDTVGKMIEYLSCKKDMQLQTLDSIKEFNEFCSSAYSCSSWEIKKFAGKLKQCVAIILDIPVEGLEKEEIKNKALGKEWTRYGVADGFFVKNGDQSTNNGNDKKRAI